MPYAFTLTTVIKAAPQAIYDAWLDSRAHSAMTGGKAKQSAKVGDRVTAWDGYITGRNVALIPGQTIVQTWRTTKFTSAHEDSTITVNLSPVAGGTQLTLTHADVPDDQTSYETEGWQNHYFAPMQKYFAKAAGKTAAAARPARSARKKPARAVKKSAAKKAKKKPARKPAKRTAKRSAPKRKTKKR
jgi:uncharacterized protein YndB with AHSA1/START domain